MTVRVLDPLRDALQLREAVHRLFEEPPLRPPHPAGPPSPRGALPVNLRDTRDAFLVEAWVPGFRPEEIEVHFEKDTLTLRAARRAEVQADPEASERWLLRELHPARLSRSILLPAPVDAERAEATCRDGVLTLTLPKLEAVRPRHIPVSWSSSSSGQ